MSQFCPYIKTSLGEELGIESSSYVSFLPMVVTE